MWLPIHEKYRDAGFATPSGKIEIFSTVLPAVGEPALPEFRAPLAKAAGFPLTPDHGEDTTLLP